jgi:hypothetical protein
MREEEGTHLGKEKQGEQATRSAVEKGLERWEGWSWWKETSGSQSDWSAQAKFEGDQLAI